MERDRKYSILGRTGMLGVVGLLCVACFLAGNSSASDKPVETIERQISSSFTVDPDSCGMTEDEANELRILPGIEPIHDIVAPMEKGYILISFNVERKGYLLICLKRPPSDILGQSTSSFISTQDNS